MPQEKLRCYFVIDMKSFFASVECSLRGLDPMTTDLVVADKERSEKTICLAVSPSLKEKGVKNRCRLFEIPKNLEYIIAPPRMQEYINYASEIYAIYLKYVNKDDIHVYSIDESFLDVTDYLKLYQLKAKDFAKKLMQEIYEKLHIPATCGIGTNLYLAKIALDITAKKSPDRIGWLTEEKYIRELWHHQPLNDFWQISTGTINRLAKYGIHDMAGIASCEEDILYEEFGINAELLIDHAFGRETCLMEDIKKYKVKGSRSFSNSQILPSDYTFDEAKIVLKEMLQDGCYRLAREGMVTTLVGIRIAYGDVSPFKTDKKTYQKYGIQEGSVRLPVTTNVYSVIGQFGEELYDKIIDKDRKVRQVAYVFGELLNEEYERYDLLTDETKVTKEKNRVKSVLNIQDKFGKNYILKGIDLGEKSTQKDRNDMIGGHRSGKNQNVTK